MNDAVADKALATLTKVERERHPTLRPRDAATLMVVDRSGAAPKVLMGRRHMRHAFMPGKFVFPGGRVEAFDGRMPVVSGLAPVQEERLLKFVRRPGAARARALALAAIRETCEETGLLIGRRSDTAPETPDPAWNDFADAGIVPDLSGLSFIARAITPPGRSRRFDARFFVADAENIAHRIDGVIGPDSELDEIVWVPVSEARDLDLPTITQIVVDELGRRLASGLDPAQPVPFYRTLRGRVVREML